MNRPLALLALLTVSVCACGREAPNAEPQTAASEPQATVQPAPQTSAPAANATPQDEIEQATSAQESVTETATEEASDASLERLAALPASQQLPSGRWKEGVHYTPLVPAQPTSVGSDKVEVMEVFWYGCSHCYALEPYLASWNKNNPDYIEFVRVPVMWGPVHRAHARLFYTLEALDREDLHQKVFDAIHRGGNMLVANDEGRTLAMQTDFATANGIDADAFRKAHGSFSVNSKLQRAEEITRRYRVEGVPLLAVNGKYTTDVGKAGDQNKLMALLTDLAASERH